MYSTSYKGRIASAGGQTVDCWWPFQIVAGYIFKLTQVRVTGNERVMWKTLYLIPRNLTYVLH